MMKISFIIVVLSLILIGLWRWNTQSQHYLFEVAIPESFPENSFSHQQFEHLLQRFVSAKGNIHYQQWLDTENAHLQLKQYLAAVAKYSPENAPHRFPSDQDELAYWIYSYNALVIHIILSNWPLNSVTDIKAPIELIKGMGFFYNQKFIIGGKSYNLYQLEQQKMVKANADPRLHFALNCGSKSCQPMRPRLPVGAELSTFLQQITVEFIDNTENVSFDSKTGTLKLSTLFEWYKADFAQYALSQLYLQDKPLSQQQALIIFIDHFRTEKLLPATETITIEFQPYQWKINEAQAISGGNKNK
ncbi:MAG: DUF547 domain-containing protein [Colwellia sp.]